MSKQQHVQNSMPRFNLEFFINHFTFHNWWARCIYKHKLCNFQSLDRNKWNKVATNVKVINSHKKHVFYLKRCLNVVIMVGWIMTPKGFLVLNPESVKMLPSGQKNPLWDMILSLSCLGCGKLLEKDMFGGFWCQLLNEKKLKRHHFHSQKKTRWINWKSINFPRSTENWGKRASCHL